MMFPTVAGVTPHLCLILKVFVRGVTPAFGINWIR